MPVMRYRIQGGNSATGAEIALTIDAPNADVASRIAESRGIYVSGVEPEAPEPDEADLTTEADLATAAAQARRPLMARPPAAVAPRPEVVLTDVTFHAGFKLGLCAGLGLVVLSALIGAIWLAFAALIALLLGPSH